MNINVYDFLTPRNHINLYTNLLNIFSNICDTRILTQEDYFLNSEIKKKVTEIIEIPSIKTTQTMLGRKLRSLYFMLKMKKDFNEHAYDVKVVFTFDTVAFSIGKLFLNTNNTFLIHHKNIDELRSLVKRFLFGTYMNKVNHIVFEDSFKSYLVNEIGVNEDLVFVIPHPVSTINTEINAWIEHIYDCVGLSNSNDESFILNIIEAEKSTNFIKNNELKVVLRSKHHSFNNGYLKVINGYLDKQEYDAYIDKANLIFVPLPEQYCYRVSGAVFDAFSNFKRVVSNESPIIVEYNKKYPKLCINVRDVDSFNNALLHNKKIEIEKSDFESFINKHNLENVEFTYKKIFERFMNENTQ